MADITQTIQQLVAMYDAGRNPSQLMQALTQRNPNIQQMQTQMQNMAQGKTPAQFIIEIARQNGANEQSLQGLARILGANK